MCFLERFSEGLHKGPKRNIWHHMFLARNVLLHWDNKRMLKVFASRSEFSLRRKTMAFGGMCEACGRKTMDVQASLIGARLVCGPCGQKELRRLPRRAKLSRIPQLKAA